MKSDLGLQTPRSITERGVFITSVIQAMQRIFNRTAVVGFTEILQISHKFGDILEIAVRLQKNKKRREKPFPV